MVAPPYCGRLAIKPFAGPFVKLRGDLRTGVGVQGWKGDERQAESGDAPSRWLWSGAQDTPVEPSAER